MELRLGFEPLDDYLKYELYKGAMKLVQDVMLAKPGETVMVTADTSTDMRVANALAAAAYAIDAVPVLVEYPTAKETCIDPPLPLQAAACKADVWIELADKNVQHTLSWQKALSCGCRYTCLTGMDVDMIVRCITHVDYDLVIKLGEKMKSIIEQAGTVQILSKNGTDLRGEMQGRRVRHSGRKAIEKGQSNMMCGQISWNCMESTINGTLVFDGALWPPAEIGLLSAPVKLTVEKGVVTKVEGGRDADIFRGWLAGYNDPASYRVAHYSLGFNPGVMAPTGRIVEDERVFGGIEFGIGIQGASILAEKWDAPSHTDGTILKPTILLDGKVFEEDGVYQHPEVREICKELGVAGY